MTLPTISQILGYPDDTLEPTIIPSRLERVTWLIARYVELQAQLDAIDLETLALKKVDTLEFDYSGVWGFNHSRLNSILDELSSITGLPIIGYPVAPTTISIVSYW